MCKQQLPISPCLSSMAVKGYKQPLTQEDMWELNESDSTAHINQRFQHFMDSELAAARIRFQHHLKRTKAKDINKVQTEASQNDLSNGLAKGVSQDMLMMVSVQTKNNIYNKNILLYPKYILLLVILLIFCPVVHGLLLCAQKQYSKIFFFCRRKREGRKIKRRRKRTKRRRKRNILIHGWLPPFTRPLKGFWLNLPF